MAAWRSTREWKAPRCRRRRVRVAKKVSTALTQEQEVGVKWKVQRGWRASQARTLPESKAGDYVDFTADINVLVAMSNCPQERNICNGFRPTPMRVIHYRPE